MGLSGPGEIWADFAGMRLSDAGSSVENGHLNYKIVDVAFAVASGKKCWLSFVQ